MLKTIYICDICGKLFDSRAEGLRHTRDGCAAHNRGGPKAYTSEEGKPDHRAMKDDDWTAEDRR